MVSKISCWVIALLSFNRSPVGTWVNSGIKIERREIALLGWERARAADVDESTLFRYYPLMSHKRVRLDTQPWGVGCWRGGGAGCVSNLTLHQVAPTTPCMPRLEPLACGAWGLAFGGRRVDAGWTGGKARTV